MMRLVPTQLSQRRNIPFSEYEAVLAVGDAALLGNTISEVVGLALQATAPAADVPQAFAEAGGIGVTDAALDPAGSSAVNAAGSALVRGIAALQESGNITQLGLTSVIEESAPGILSLAGRSFAGPVAWAKLGWDVAQFFYEFGQCVR